MLQLSGHGGVDPPAVTFTAVSIRKFVVKVSRLRELVELGTLTTQQ